MTEKGLRIFPGMETDVKEGGHILCVGQIEEILELNKRLDPFKEKGEFLPFEKLMQLFSEYSVIVGGAHPFREGGHIPELAREPLTALDFLDLNGKDVAADRKGTEEQTYKLAEALKIPVVSGSDTHQAVQYGCIRTKMRREVNTVEELMGEMKTGNYEIRVSDYADFQVKTAGILKKALKEIHAIGGNYVSVLVS